MKRTRFAPLAVMLAALPAFAQEADVVLLSGRTVSFHDVIRDGADDTLRFRFLEPDLAMVVEVIGYDRLEADMRFLCESYALPRIERAPAQILISISDRPVTFGAPDPQATQVFEAYRPEDGACIWEGF